MVYCPECNVANRSSDMICKNCGYVLLHNQSHWEVHDCGRCRGTGCPACNRGKIVTWGRPQLCRQCNGTGTGPYGATTLDKKCHGTGYSNGIRKPDRIARW